MATIMLSCDTDNNNIHVHLLYNPSNAIGLNESGDKTFPSYMKNWGIYLCDNPQI